MAGSRRKNGRRPKSGTGEMCVVHADGTVEDSSIHDEILSGLDPKDEAKMRKQFQAQLRELGLTEEEIALIS